MWIIENVEKWKEYYFLKLLSTKEDYKKPLVIVYIWYIHSIHTMWITILFFIVYNLWKEEEKEQKYGASLKII